MKNALAQIPIMLCCNDTNGNWADKIVKVQIGEAIELETMFVSDDYDLAGLECTLKGAALIYVRVHGLVISCGTSL